jgi:hypothetical protein
MMRVLYIAGAGRCGSTLLSGVLGQSDDVIDVGELWKIWLVRNDGTGRRCGCGVPLIDCPFWDAVESTSPGVLDPDPEVLATIEHIGHARRSPALAAKLLVGSAGTAAWVDRLERLYAGVSVVSGASIIVDSSKMPGPALVIARRSSVDLRVLHLIRDPLAVASSWSYRKEDGGNHPLEARGAGQAARAWAARAWSTELLVHPSLARGAFRRIRFEDVLEDPERRVTEVLRFTGSYAASPAFIAPRRVHLDSSHTCGGNPVRFGPSEREIMPSPTAGSALTEEAKTAVLRATRPLRRLYGYR